MKEILFIGDINRGGQAVNVQKLARLFSPVLKQLGLSYNTYISPINEICAREEWLDTWREAFSKQQSNLSQLDLTDKAIVGFEIPKHDLDYLSLNNVPWVNIEIHPVRFLDDLYFEVSTSFEYNLNHLAANSGVIEFCANALKLKYPPIQLKSSTLAILGQEPYDKSIFFDGKFKGLTHYYSELDKLAEQHDKVVYRPHPYLSEEKVEQEICQRYNATISKDRNFYELICSGQFSTVCAISSSVVTEAQLFGLQGIFLESKARRFGLPISYSKLLDDPDFWFKGLLARNESVAYEPISIAVPKNFLRETYASWGYLTERQEVQAQIDALANLSQKAEQAETKARQAKAKAEENFAELQAVIGSRSWRLTAPLRWCNFQTGLLKHHGAKARFKASVKKILKKLVNFVNARPKFKRLLITSARRLGLINLLKKLYWVAGSHSWNPYESQKRRNSESLDTLSPRASEIFHDLKSAIEKKKEQH